MGEHYPPSVDLELLGGDNRYTDAFKNEGGYSAVENMVAGHINGVAGSVVHRVGSIYSTGGTTWECRVDGNPRVRIVEVG